MSSIGARTDTATASLAETPLKASFTSTWVRVLPSDTVSDEVTCPRNTALADGYDPQADGCRNQVPLAFVAVNMVRTNTITALAIWPVSAPDFFIRKKS